jgi:hydrogenase maturation protein HypF
MKRLLKISPGTVAHDLHPDYASTSIARSLPGRKLAVQHHAAHALSVAAEHGITGPFLGVAFDGTGYGSDGRIWGSEFLEFSGRTWRRAAHFAYFALPGGDAGALELWRPALSLVRAAFGPGWRKEAGRLFSGVGKPRLATVERMLASGLNSPLTSSMGRLFDAFSFIAGVRAEATYEAQGPMEMESLLARRLPGSGYRFGFSGSAPAVIDPSPAVRAAVSDRLAGRTPAHISARFHAGLAGAAVSAAASLASSRGISVICLSGGVFQNRVLLETVSAGLSRRGFRVLSNSRVPANDGGIALGQAWYALKGYRQAGSLRLRLRSRSD